MYITQMEIRISATELARKVGDVLGRVRYVGDSFVVERNGEPVARIAPLDEHPRATLADAFDAWRGASDAEPDFADALAKIDGMDRPPESPWAS
jgi:antitoxin (DNA-binding transcriptional repressor) of toxin-antitoxin stability system